MLAGITYRQSLEAVEDMADQGALHGAVRWLTAVPQQVGPLLAKDTLV